MSLTVRLYAAKLMGFEDDDQGPVLTTEQRGILDACARSFLYFLQFWKFKNRELGETSSFHELWEGQLEFALRMGEHPWLFALKAGKLGFTELECAYDAWVALFRQPNARVHLFSLDAKAAQQLLDYVRFGLKHLPPWLSLPIMGDEPGGNTMESLKLSAGPDDVRTIVSYAAGLHVSIDQSATHVHVDELARMAHPEQTWSAIQSTVAPTGSCHIVTRGRDDDFVSGLWEAAVTEEGQLAAIFAPWSARPRDTTWRVKQSGTMSAQQLFHFAPETAEDALAGDETSEYIPMPIWDACLDTTIPQLLPGDKEPIVLGVDGAVSGDMFAIVGVSRHPAKRDQVAIRACKVWNPEEHGGRVNFDDVERFLRWVVSGGCSLKHPQAMPLAGCVECEAGRFGVPGHNVVQVTYDPYQLEHMRQRLRFESWWKEFQQGQDREIADSLLHKLALRRQISHYGDVNLREHILNCRAKLSKDDDSRMRIIKRSPSRKIDLAVATSMAVFRCLRLNL